MIKIILPVEKIEHEILNHFVDEYDVYEDSEKDKELEFTFEFSHLGRKYNIDVMYNITKVGYVEWQRDWISATDQNKTEVNIHFAHINHNPKAESLQSKIDAEMERKIRIHYKNVKADEGIRQTNEWLRRNII